MEYILHISIFRGVLPAYPVLKQGAYLTNSLLTIRHLSVIFYSFQHCRAIENGGPTNG